MTLSLNDTTPELILKALTDELLESSSAAEISHELELMLSVYVQHAPVSRLSLANTAGLAARLIAYFSTVGAAMEQKQLITGLEQFTE